MGGVVQHPSALLPCRERQIDSAYTFNIPRFMKASGSLACVFVLGRGNRKLVSVASSRMAYGQLVTESVQDESTALIARGLSRHSAFPGGGVNALHQAAHSGLLAGDALPSSGYRILSDTILQIQHSVRAGVPRLGTPAPFAIKPLVFIPSRCRWRKTECIPA